MKRVIKSLMKEGQEDKKIIENLKKEVEHRNGIIESIIGENETLRTEGEKKQQPFIDVQKQSIA